jgi:hypothetical protein
MRKKMAKTKGAKGQRVSVSCEGDIKKRVAAGQDAEVAKYQQEDFSASTNNTCLSIQKSNIHSFDEQVADLVNTVYTGSTPLLQQETALAAINKVLQKNFAIQDLNKKGNFIKELAGAIKERYAGETYLNRMNKFLVAVRKPKNGLEDDNPLKIYKIQLQRMIQNCHTTLKVVSNKAWITLDNITDMYAVTMHSNICTWDFTESTIGGPRMMQKLIEFAEKGKLTDIKFSAKTIQDIQKDERTHTDANGCEHTAAKLYNVLMDILSENRRIAEENQSYAAKVAASTAATQAAFPQDNTIDLNGSIAIKTNIGKELKKSTASGNNSVIIRLHNVDVASIRALGHALQLDSHKNVSLDLRGNDFSNQKIANALQDLVRNCDTIKYVDIDKQYEDRYRPGADLGAVRRINSMYPVLADRKLYAPKSTVKVNVKAVEVNMTDELLHTPNPLPKKYASYADAVRGKEQPLELKEPKRQSEGRNIQLYPSYADAVLGNRQQRQSNSPT